MYKLIADRFIILLAIMRRDLRRKYYLELHREKTRKIAAVLPLLLDTVATLPCENQKLQFNRLKVILKVKSSTCYSASYTSQTRDQKRTSQSPK